MLITLKPLDPYQVSALPELTGKIQPYNLKPPLFLCVSAKTAKRISASLCCHLKELQSLGYFLPSASESEKSKKSLTVPLLYSGLLRKQRWSFGTM